MTRLLIATLLLAAAALLIAPDASRAEDTAAPKAPTSNPATPDAGAPLKFYGTISAVDATAKTFTIDDKVYSVVPESHMTKAADDSQATLDDAKVGETARGTYTKTADGKMNITKVRFGKKAGGGKAKGEGGGKKKGEAGGTAAAATQPKE